MGVTLGPKLKSHNMADPTPITHYGDRDAVDGVAVPGLHEYYEAHRVRGLPSLDRLDLLWDCTRLILYNVQSHTTQEIWHEMRMCLGHILNSIVKIKRVSGLNRNPHADLWVRKDQGSSLLSLIRERTKIRMKDWGSLHSNARRYFEGSPLSRETTQDGEESPQAPRDEGRSSRVMQWRLALWQPWRERRMKPAKPQPIRPLRRPPTSIVTFNVNGFHSKKVEIDDLLGDEDVAVLALQETLVTARHYPVHMPGYRAYTSNAKEDFRGIAVLVDNRYASYEVPHGVHWMLHVKVFNYAGLTGPIHFINVYLKSGGNHRRTRRDQLTVVKGIVAKILERDGNSKVVVLGDMNEPDKALVHHLNVVGNMRNHLFPAHFVGRTYFPVKGEPSAIDNILLTETSQRLFRGARVLRDYNLSDHRPVRMSPYADITATERVQRPARASFDTKMIYLKGDLIANDNAWTKLMQQAYGEEAVNGDYAPIVDDDTRAKVSTFANEFIDTFDKVCRKHDVKRVHQPGSNPEFPKKLKLLQQTVHRYSKRWQKAVDAYRTPDESTCIRLV
jgi:exonuclease III